MESITATYTQAEDTTEVMIVVSGLSGLDEPHTATAPDLLAARTLVDRVIAGHPPATGSTPVVVHLLNGSATAFTRAYLAATFTQPGHRPA